jgi:hypothetical protein
MRPLAALLLVVQVLLRGVAAGHSTAADAHAPAIQPHLHFGANAHDHRPYDHGHRPHDHGHRHLDRFGHHGHGHRHDGVPTEPGTGTKHAGSSGESSHGHECDAIFLVDEGVNALLGTQAASFAAGEPAEWIDTVTNPSGTATHHGRPATRWVRPPGDPASPFLTLLPHRLRV